MPPLIAALLLSAAPAIATATAAAAVHIDGDTPWVIASADPQTGGLGSALHLALRDVRRDWCGRGLPTPLSSSNLSIASSASAPAQPLAQVRCVRRAPRRARHHVSFHGVRAWRAEPSARTHLGSAAGGQRNRDVSLHRRVRDAGGAADATRDGYLPHRGRARGGEPRLHVSNTSRAHEAVAGSECCSLAPAASYPLARGRATPRWSAEALGSSDRCTPRTPSASTS